MEISKELTPIAYDLSKKVYNKSISFRDAQNELVGNGRMNKNSAADYINNFRCMIEGQRFTRTNNAFSIDYFLENILKDYGVKKLNNALTALQLHFEYYEEIQNVTMHKMRALHQKYSSIPLEEHDNIEQTEIIREIKQNNKSREEIIKELKNLKPSDPEEIIINHKTYKRDNRTIGYIKHIRDFKCQICYTSIRKKDGTHYIEAAHIEPKHKKGRETPDNIILLCPNHHKEFDFGALEITKHNIESVEFTLNGISYTISLNIDTLITSN